MGIIKDSHTELGAALNIMSDILRRLQPRLELSDNSNHRNKHVKSLSEVWNLFLIGPFDTIISLLLLFAFIDIFGAGSSGSVLSAGVASDTTALVASRRCYLRNRYGP